MIKKADAQYVLSAKLYKIIRKIAIYKHFFASLGYQFRFSFTNDGRQGDYNTKRNVV